MRGQYLTNQNQVYYLETIDGAQGDQELLRRAQRKFRVDLLSLFNPRHFLLRRKHREKLLNALLVNDGTVHLHHSIFDYPVNMHSS